MFGLKNKIANRDQQAPVANINTSTLAIEKDLASLDIYDYMKKKVISNKELEILVSPDCLSIFNL
jgi:hypothetical protein